MPTLPKPLHAFSYAYVAKLPILCFIICTHSNSIQIIQEHMNLPKKPYVYSPGIINNNNAHLPLASCHNGRGSIL